MKLKMTVATYDLELMEVDLDHAAVGAKGSMHSSFQFSHMHHTRFAAMRH